jgi:hypothetical protein
MGNNPDHDDAQGMNTLDLMSASLAIRCITRVMLRSRQAMSHTQIVDGVEAMTASQPIAREEIDRALADLVEKGWLECTEAGGELIYEVKIQKKEGSDVSRAQARDAGSGLPSGVISDLWDAVEAGSEAAQGGTRAQREMSDMHRQSSGGQPPPDSEEEENESRQGLFGFLKRKRNP